MTNILQMIDSLAVGGAERVAVNYANAISQKDGYLSFLCISRESGPLEAQINEDVDTIILKRKNVLDWKAIKRCVDFVKFNNIDIIHAHTSSFLLAAIINLFHPVKIVWHLHNGNMKNARPLYLKLMRMFSKKFDSIITVNEELKEWAQSYFSVTEERVIYLPNYPDLQIEGREISLPGTRGQRIVSLANIRWQKDHHNLVEGMSYLVNEKKCNWHLLLIGAFYNDQYEKSLRELILREKVQDNIHFLGIRNDVGEVLANSTIGVISSKVEGLPVSLLEYGLVGLSVITTNVGECANVVADGVNGIVVPKEDHRAFGDALYSMVSDEKMRNRYRNNFHSHIVTNYSREAIIVRLTDLYNMVSDEGVHNE